MRRTFFYFILLVCIVCSYTTAAQTANADSLFAIARKAAFEDKDYSAAIGYAHMALAVNPRYTDVVVFTGRLHGWQKNVDSARYYFDMALQQRRTIDAYAAYADLELWNDNSLRALELLDSGLVHNPGAVPLLIRKARILNARREFESAIHIVDTLLAIDKSNTVARALGVQIRDNISKNRVGLKYDYVHFDQQFPDPWQFISLDYTRQTKAGPVTARLNYANRFKADGLQYELEAYPRISRTFYTYANIAYSDDVGVFPKWRAGVSLYANLPKAFEAEAGIRYLYFTDNAFIYTFYAGKYISNLLVGARTYLTPASTRIAQSYSVLARYYYKGVDDYIGFSAGVGLSPDDRRVNVLLDNSSKLRTYQVELVVRHSIKRLNILTFNCSVLNQEYMPAVVGNQLQLGIGYIRRF